MDIIFATLLFFVLFRAIMTKEDGMCHRILLIGFGMRLVLLLCTSLDLFTVPDAHGDADAFHDLALAHPSPFEDGAAHMTNYTRWLTVLYMLTDDSRWFAQYLNVVLSVLTLLYVRRILYVLDIQEMVAKRLLLVLALMPFVNVYSVVLIVAGMFTNQKELLVQSFSGTLLCFGVLRIYSAFRKTKIIYIQ